MITFNAGFVVFTNILKTVSSETWQNPTIAFDKKEINKVKMNEGKYKKDLEIIQT